MKRKRLGEITELVPGAHNSHNNNVTYPLTVLCCQWDGGIRVGSMMVFVGSTGMEGEQRAGLSWDHSPHQGREKANVAVFLY